MTFRNLPLTPEQDAEVRAYIEGCEARGEPWDVLELCYILGVYPRGADLQELPRENDDHAA
jgi:hypothetical protein